jgi:hypothetical protein
MGATTATATVATIAAIAAMVAIMTAIVAAMAWHLPGSCAPPSSEKERASVPSRQY